MQLGIAGKLTQDIAHDRMTASLVSLCCSCPDFSYGICTILKIILRQCSLQTTAGKNRIKPVCFHGKADGLLHINIPEFQKLNL